MSLPHDRLLVGWGEARKLATDMLDSTQPAFYLSDFFLETSQPWRQYSHWTDISIQDFKEQLGSVAPLATPHWAIRSPAQFKQAFEELCYVLQSEQLEKAVPYLFAVSSHRMTEERLKQCLKTAIESKIGYVYGCWNEGEGVLGVTPELLFSHTQERPREVCTMALAGTCHSSACQERFLQSKKEHHEHQVVIQGICQALSPLGSVQVEVTQLLKLPKLMHLMTPIKLELNQPFDFEALVSHLHPTPALGAFPKEEGQKWLRKYQQHTPRKSYGAPIGFVEPRLGLAQCLVGIRNVQWDHKGMYMGAGCGVVKQSTLEREWREITFKMRAIRHQLGV